MRSVSPTIAGDVAAALATAIPPYSFNELQRAGDISRRRLVQVRPNQSNWSCGILPRLTSVREAVPPASRNLPVGAFVAAAGTFHSQLSGANRSADILARDKQAFQDRCHRAIPHRSDLSSALSFREGTCATKGLGNVRKAFGELRNV